MNEDERPGHDLRLIVPAVATWLAAALMIGTSPAVAYTSAVAASLAALLLLARRVRRPGADMTGARGPVWTVAGVLFVCVAASSAAVGMRAAAVGSGPVHEIARERGRATAEAVLTSAPQAAVRPGRPMVLARARVEAVQVRGRRVRVRVPVLLVAGDRRWLGLLPSQRTRLSGTLVPPRRAELLAAVVFVRGPPDVLGAPSAVQRAAEEVRAKLRAATEPLPPDQRAVLPAMVVGDTSRLDPELADDFRTAGLTHLLVVSGANLAIIIGAVLGLCRIAGLGRRRAPPLAVVAVLAFVVVARPEPSVLRATVMGLIGLLALVTGRERQGLPALGAAVLLLVLIDPALARSYGFALSVLATGGLLILAPVWRQRLRRWLPGPPADALAVAAAAQVAVAPVLVLLSGEVGVVAVAANLLAAPAVAPATLLGALAAVVAPVTLPVAQVIVLPAGLAVGWIAGIARRAADLPYATIPWMGGGLGAAGLVIALVVAALVLRSRRARGIVVAAMAGVLIAVVALRAIAPGWPPPGWALVACDVGQGDALVLATGRASAVVVDTGPEPRLVDGCLDRLSVQEVSLLVLTHSHADHIDGTAGVRSGRTVRTVLVTPSAFGREARHTSGLAVRSATAGQRWAVGDLTLTVLGPAPAAPRLSASDEGTTLNNASIVVVARAPGFSALLSGDVEEEAQRVLAASVPPVQVLKVPHHGARSQDRSFFAAAHPTISIISVGKENDYGHPSPATLDLLRRHGGRIHRTDRDGDVAITRTEGGLAVVTRR